jgi:hypothetical protein
VVQLHVEPEGEVVLEGGVRSGGALDAGFGFVTFSARGGCLRWRLGDPWWEDCVCGIELLAGESDISQQENAMAVGLMEACDVAYGNVDAISRIWSHYACFQRMLRGAMG